MIQPYRFSWSLGNQKTVYLLFSVEKVKDVSYPNTFPTKYEGNFSLDPDLCFHRTVIQEKRVSSPRVTKQSSRPLPLLTLIHFYKCLHIVISQIDIVSEYY